MCFVLSYVRCVCRRFCRLADGLVGWWDRGGRGTIIWRWEGGNKLSYRNIFYSGAWVEREGGGYIGKHLLHIYHPTHSASREMRLTNVNAKSQYEQPSICPYKYPHPLSDPYIPFSTFKSSLISKKPHDGLWGMSRDPSTPPPAAVAGCITSVQTSFSSLQLRGNKYAIH